jgi:hypothetical protein
MPLAVVIGILNLFSVCEYSDTIAESRRRLLATRVLQRAGMVQKINPSPISAVHLTIDSDVSEAEFASLDGRLLYSIQCDQNFLQRNRFHL